MHITRQSEREGERKRDRESLDGLVCLPASLPVAVLVNFNYFLQMMIKLASGSTDIKSISALPPLVSPLPECSLCVCVLATALKRIGHARIGRQFTGLRFIMP